MKISISDVVDQFIGSLTGKTIKVGRWRKFRRVVSAEILDWEDPVMAVQITLDDGSKKWISVFDDIEIADDAS